MPMMLPMATLRYTTAGESHGPQLTTIVEGLPAGVPVRSRLWMKRRSVAKVDTAGEDDERIETDIAEWVGGSDCRTPRAPQSPFESPTEIRVLMIWNARLRCIDLVLVMRIWRVPSRLSATTAAKLLSGPAPVKPLHAPPPAHWRAACCVSWALKWWALCDHCLTFAPMSNQAPTVGKISLPPAMPVTWPVLMNTLQRR